MAVAKPRYNLSQLALLFEKIDTSSFSGKVICQNNTKTVELYFQRGRLVDAKSLSKTETSEEVLYDLLSWQDGWFSWEAGEFSTEITLDGSQIADFMETVKLLQAKGRFEAAAKTQSSSSLSPVTKPDSREVKTEPVIKSENVEVKAEPTVKAETFTQPELNEAEKPAATAAPLFEILSRPVQWEQPLQVVKPVAAKVAASGTTSQKKPLLPEAVAPLSTELEKPVAIEIAPVSLVKPNVAPAANANEVLVNQVNVAPELQSVQTVETFNAVPTNFRVTDLSIRLDMTETVATLRTDAVNANWLTLSQASLLTTATNCILQLLATLVGSNRMVNTAQQILGRAKPLFPCLQYLQLRQSQDHLEVKWLAEGNQITISKNEAQTAFNFILAALISQNSDLLDADTIRELARRSLTYNQIDLNREQLSLNFL